MQRDVLENWAHAQLNGQTSRMRTSFFKALVRHLGVIWPTRRTLRSLVDKGYIVYDKRRGWRVTPAGFDRLGWYIPPS